MSQTTTTKPITKTVQITPDLNLKGLNIPLLDINELKRRIMERASTFPTVSFTIYLIFAISTAILVGYLLASNSGDSSVRNNIIIWGLFIAGITVFVINRILFFVDFEYKPIIIAILMIIQTGLTGSSLIAARNLGYIGNNYTDLYYVAHGMNILTTALGLVPLYYST